MLAILKQFNDYIKQSSTFNDITISPLLDILAKVPSNDVLLSDFLHTSGYHHCKKVEST